MLFKLRNYKKLRIKTHLALFVCQKKFTFIIIYHRHFSENNKIINSHASIILKKVIKNNGHIISINNQIYEKVSKFLRLKNDTKFLAPYNPIAIILHLSNWKEET